LATVTISAGGSQTLDPGTAYSVTVTNTGVENALVNSEKLKPGQNETFYLQGTALVATSRYGTTLSYTVGSAPTTSPAASTGRQPYLGPVATRGRIPTGRIASSIYKQIMTWSRHVATDDITALSLLYSSINGVGEVTTTAGPGTVKASVEYPQGTYTEILFSGATSGTVPDVSHLVSDLTTLTTKIPAGSTFWVGTYSVWTGTQTPILSDAFDNSLAANTREAVNASTTSVTDTRLTGVRNTGGTNPRDCYRPTAILGMTQKPTIFLAGDSRTRAGLSWDANADQGGLQGLTEQVIGGRFGYINAGVGTDRYSNVTSGTGNNYVKRLALSAYCTHIVDDYGINSVFSDTSAAHQALVTSFRAKFAGKPYYKTTLIPQLSATSLQIAADGSDQTPFGTLANFVANNNWVRQGAAGLIDGFIELEDLVTLRRDSGKFQRAERVVTDGAMTSGSNVLTSATAAFTSADVGKQVHVTGAGASGANLYVTIGVVTNATTVTLLQSTQTAPAANAGTTVSGASVGIGVLSPDNTHQSARLEAVIRDSNAWRALSSLR
jgi:hypothetical protein